jgi:hypothetical protein
MGLRPIQSFNIIFFQDEKAAALDQGLLVANPSNKDKALKWLDTITTTGTTNPIPGIEMAFRSRPQLVYLLTDADFPDNRAVKDLVAKVNGGRQTKVNTIVFTSDDGQKDASTAFVELMKEIAKDNGGVFTSVKETDLR